MKIPASASWCLAGQEVDHPRDTTIDRLFQDLLETDADQLNRVALINAETNAEVTYGELNERANCMARMLLRKIKKSNLKPNPDGDYVVALRFLPGEQLIATILAIFKAGLAYVPHGPPSKINTGCLLEADTVVSAAEDSAHSFLCPPS